MEFFQLSFLLRFHYVCIVMLLLCAYNTTSPVLAEGVSDDMDSFVYVMPTSNEVTVKAVPSSPYDKRSSAPSQLSLLLGQQTADILWNIPPQRNSHYSAETKLRLARRAEFKNGRNQFGVNSGIMGLEQSWEEDEGNDDEEMALPWLPTVRAPKPKKVTAYKLVKDSDNAEYVNDVFLARGVPLMKREDLRLRPGVETNRGDGRDSTGGYYGVMRGGQMKNNDMYFDDYVNMDSFGGANRKKWEMVTEEQHQKQAARRSQQQLRANNRKYIVDNGFY
eukprot:GHVS01007647.1.p1 GENE.GHVS01007647.1~~GHVS01007647.1.p1  ORF type:complete len:311 (+),score=46.19 GHVS01007647.1:103-933(+)